MSGRGSAVLEHVKGIGAKQRLRMLAPLKKPFETSAVLRILNEAPRTPTGAGRTHRSRRGVAQ